MGKATKEANTKPTPALKATFLSKYFLSIKMSLICEVCNQSPFIFSCFENGYNGAFRGVFCVLERAERYRIRIGVYMDIFQLFLL